MLYDSHTFLAIQTMHANTFNFSDPDYPSSIARARRLKSTQLFIRSCPPTYDSKDSEGLTSDNPFLVGSIPQQVCAAGIGGSIRGTCSGDSGGPLYYRHHGGSGARYYQVMICTVVSIKWCNCFSFTLVASNTITAKDGSMVSFGGGWVGGWKVYSCFYWHFVSFSVWNNFIWAPLCWPQPKWYSSTFHKHTVLLKLDFGQHERRGLDLIWKLVQRLQKYFHPKVSNSFICSFHGELSLYILT